MPSTQSKNRNKRKKSKPWWQWVIIVILWPVVLSLWFWENRRIDLPKKTKGIIIGIFWVFLILLIILIPKHKKVEEVSDDVVLEEPIEAETEIKETVVPTEEPQQKEEENVEAQAEDELVYVKPLEEIYVAYATEKVNVREQPNTDCNVLGKAQEGEGVNVLGTEGDWTHVMFGGMNGYIKSEFLTKDNPNTANGNDGEGDILPEVPEGKFVVDKDTGKIHTGNCSTLQEVRNRMLYDSVGDAELAGFTSRCDVCNPK